MSSLGRAGLRSCPLIFVAMMELPKDFTFYNSHLHIQTGTPESCLFNSIVSCDLGEYPSLRVAYPNIFFSVGLHPWFLTEDGEKIAYSMERLETVLFSDPLIMAVGECGLDKGKKAIAIEKQKIILQTQWHLSIKYHKPLIFHIVRAWSELLLLAKSGKKHPCGLIVHGFRGNVSLAKQLLRAGFYLSVHSLCPTDTLRLALESNRLLLETDASSISIESVYRNVSQRLDIELPYLVEQIQKTFLSLFPVRKTESIGSLD